ncbi:MAG: hypothetical protein ACPGD5_10000 [Salibacteraceae bacterium]
MRKIAILGLLAFFVIGVGTVSAQEEKKSKKKKTKLWGGYDSNAIDKNLIIKEAYVVLGEKLLDGVVVNATVNGTVLYSDTTDKNGGFEFALPFDRRYILDFNKVGFVTKKVEIDLTTLPTEAKNEGYDLGRFRMTMVKYTEGMNIEDYKVPVARYRYNEVNAMVELDRAYLKKRKQILAGVAVNNEVVIASKEAEKDELQEEYNIIIRDADIEFEAKDYKLAKELYKEAISLKPLAEYPRNQLNIINGFLAQELGEDEKYQALIVQADEAFESKDMEVAEISYKNAIKIKTTEPYPRAQLKKIEAYQNELAKVNTAEKEKVYSLKDVQIAGDAVGFSNELAKKYPQGLTIEKFMEGSKSVERRIIVDGEVGVEYKKVTHNWGGIYYFKNGKGSNHFVWQKEAIQ